MITLPLDGYIESKLWLNSTVAAAQRTLDNIVYTMKLEATEIFATKIQGKIDDVNNGVELTTASVLALSQYVKLLEEYETSGSSCVLRELSERLNSSNPIVSNVTELQQAS